MKQNSGVFDTFPMSLITTQTVARLGEMVAAPGRQTPHTRFVQKPAARKGM